MQTPITDLAVKSTKRWKKVKVIGAILAAVLFLPMPALALTFLGAWNINQNQTGGAPAAVVTSGDSATGGFLNIDMGSYSNRVVASSAVTANRDFSIASPSEVVTFTRAIQAIFRNANLEASVTVQRLSGTSDFLFPTFDRKVGSHVRYFNRVDRRTHRMNSGTYRVLVTVRNTKEKTGFWQTVSPYHFTFNGVM